MKEEPAYQRLLRALQDMQAQIEERVRPAAKQVIQAELAHLRSLYEQQQSILSDCLALIDQSIIDCRRPMEEYRRACSDLSVINERLVNLGAEPVVISDHFSTQNLGDLILARVQGLRAQGKI